MVFEYTLGRISEFFLKFTSSMRHTFYFYFSIFDCVWFTGMSGPHGSPVSGLCSAPGVQTHAPSPGAKPWTEGESGMLFNLTHTSFELRLCPPIGILFVYCCFMLPCVIPDIVWNNPLKCMQCFKLASYIFAIVLRNL